MRKLLIRNILAVVLIILPLAAFLLFFRNTDRELELQTRQAVRSMYVEIESHGRTERILPWKQADGTYCLVLPSYAEESGRIAFCGSSRYGINVWLDNRQAEEYEFESVEEIAPSYVLELRDNTGRIQEKARLEVHCSENLPAVFVTTSSGSMDIIHASKKNKEKGSVSVYTEQGRCDYAGQLNHIKGRGNVTWEQEKKPYNLSLQQPESLLGMKSASEWALLAGAMDRSYIRNKLAFDMAGEIGLEDTSDAAFADLYLNGEYAGLYLLAEKIEGKDDPADGEEYLLEIEMRERLAGEEYGFETEAGQAVVIKGNANPSEQEVKLLKEHIQCVEDAVYKEDWGSVWNYMDKESYIKIYLMEEILQNHDAYISSQYMKLRRENGEYGKIYSGPVWDFDSCLSPKDGMYASTLTAGQSRKGYPKFWITEAVNNREFQQETAAQYRKIRAEYLERKVWDGIETYRNQISRTVELDCLRWKHQSVEEWREEIRDLQQYLFDRLAFLDEFWSGKEIFHRVNLKMESDIFSGMDYYIKHGETCGDFPRELKKEGYLFAGWYLKGTDIEFTTETPVYENLMIEARWERKPESGAMQAVLRSGILQMRYLLFFCMLSGTLLLFLYDRHAGKS